MYHFFVAQLNKVTRKFVFPAAVIHVVLKPKIHTIKIHTIRFLAVVNNYSPKWKLIVNKYNQSTGRQ